MVRQSIFEVTMFIRSLQYHRQLAGTRMDASARQQLMYKLARQPDPSVPGNMTSPDTSA